jgi:hypothetical protein
MYDEILISAAFGYLYSDDSILGVVVLGALQLGVLCNGRGLISS